MEVKDVAAVERLDLLEELGLKVDGQTTALTTELDAEKKIFTVAFDKHVIPLSQLPVI